MRIKRFLAGAIAMAGGMLLGGCCDVKEETCVYVRSRANEIADMIALCCAKPDPSGCMDDIRTTSALLKDKLNAIRQACRDNNKELVKQLQDEIKKILDELRKRQGMGLVSAPGEPSGYMNVSATLLSGETVTMSMVAAQSGSSQQTMLSVGGEMMTPEAVGAAMVDDAPGGQLAAVSYTSQTVTTSTYTIGSGGTVSLGTLLGTLNYTASGSFDLTQWQDNAGESTAKPTAGAITLTRSGVTVILTLDPSFTGNRAHGVKGKTGSIDALFKVQVAGTFAGDATALSEKIWLSLPFGMSASGATLDFASQGAQSGTVVMPAPLASVQGMEYYFGAGTPSAPLAAVAVDGCGDADGNGRRDLADEIIKNSKEFFPECYSEAQQ